MKKFQERSQMELMYRPLVELLEASLNSPGSIFEGTPGEILQGLPGKISGGTPGKIPGRNFEIPEGNPEGPSARVPEGIPGGISEETAGAILELQKKLKKFLY